MSFFTSSISNFAGKIPFIVTGLFKQLDNLCFEKREDSLTKVVDEGKTKLLIRNLNKGMLKDWNPYADVQMIATTIRIYFKGIPEQLIIPEVYDELVELSKNEFNLDAYNAAINKLPDGHKYTLAYICTFFEGYSKKIKIGLSSGFLSVISTKDGDESKNSVVQPLIQHAKELFGSLNITGASNFTEDDLANAIPLELDDKLIEQIKKRQHIRFGSLIPQGADCGTLQRPTTIPSQFKKVDHDYEYQCDESDDAMEEVMQENEYEPEDEYDYEYVLDE